MPFLVDGSRIEAELFGEHAVVNLTQLIQLLGGHLDRRTGLKARIPSSWRFTWTTLLLIPSMPLPAGPIAGPAEPSPQASRGKVGCLGCG